VQDILGSEFGRRALLLPNAIDCERFSPGRREPEAPEARTVSLQGVSGAWWGACRN
jgi:hypothetical protein